MKILLDTHILIWLASEPKKLSPAGHRRIQDITNELYFSVVSLWEIGVKRMLGRADYQLNPHVLRNALITRGYKEVSVLAEHTLEVENLPDIHGDPFDRLLVCQARVEGLTILTNDKEILQYPVSALRG